jgi:arginyl-tRNA synthetase
MIFEKQIKEAVYNIVSFLYSCELNEDNVLIQKTKKDFKGDFTVVVFPFVRYSKKSPDATAEEIAQILLKTLAFVKEYNVIKGFLNITLTDKLWVEYFRNARLKDSLADLEIFDQAPVVVEFSSPNTNKPLHLGHIRNNLIGNAVCNILEANKYHVIRVNLVNDRGIHICKSMLAWIKSGKGETPESSGVKGDKLAGKYYVEFDRLFKQEVKELEAQGLPKEQAEKQAPIMMEAQQMLQKWEEGDEEIRSLWKKMNEWVYQGFEKTYHQLGIRFDKTYYESNTYLLGKEIVADGLQKKIFYKHDDGSIRVNLADEGLDEKILLRCDGTSVYITQDLGTAVLRANEFHPQKMIYIVGNEQNYHFDVLKLILNKLGYSWGKTIYHLSYGMVELPSGKMKSREGTVVDADDLMENMIRIAKENTEKLGKTSHFSAAQLEDLFAMTGVGALKYFILKVDPKKNMLFNPEESIDLNGNTATFIQYAHARICSLLRKADAENMNISNESVHVSTIPEQEKELLRMVYEYPATVMEAGKELSPALIANYVYELVKTYNHFYQHTPIIREENKDLRIFRLQISCYTAKIIHDAMKLLGIDVPEQM